MLARLRFRLTYANVMATVAVFIALGGSSYAAIRLSKNSVRSAHIKNGQVKAPDLAANAVSSTKVRNGSLLARDFAAGQLPRGDKGEPGARGAEGPPGLGGVEVVTATSVGDSSSAQVVALSCPNGKTLISVFPSLQGAYFTGMHPNGLAKVVVTNVDRVSATAASVTAAETDGGTAANWAVQGTALCANVAP